MKWRICLTHDDRAFVEWYCGAGLDGEGWKDCEIVSRLLVDPDAATIEVYWNNEGWVISNQTPTMPAGRYIFVGEA